MSAPTGLCGRPASRRPVSGAGRSGSWRQVTTVSAGQTRPSRAPGLGPEVDERVVALTLAEPPTETTHWTADLMARASGISASAVRRIWIAADLAPLIDRQQALGRCNSAPDRAPRSHPARPAAEEGPARHRDDTTTCARHHDPVRRPQRSRRDGHRSQHAAPSSSRAHSIPEYHRGRGADPRQDDTSSSTTTPPTSTRRAEPGWIDTRASSFTSPRPHAPGSMRSFFAKLSRRRLKRGVFRSVVDLQHAINRFFTETNVEPTPFTWTADRQNHRRPERAPSGDSNH